MNDRKTVSYPVLMAILGLLTVFAACMGVRWGSAPLTFREMIQGLIHPDSGTVSARILWVVRLPRVAAAMLAGAGLAFSGLLLQSATNNPLAGPNIIGVNAGAGFALVLTMGIAPMAYRLMPVMAFAGAFLCTVLIVFTADRAGGSRVTIVLAGVAVTALLNAGISLIKLMFPDLAVAYNSFAVGGVSGVTLDYLGIPAVIIAGVIAIGAVLAARLNLLCLGDALASSLGARVRSLRMTALILASASAGAAVSFAGLLGFVGLMVPHIGRKLTGCTDLRKLIPVCVLLGGCMVTLADLLGRVLFAPSEVPAGIITALIGAPFFFVLLMQRRNRL